ncbi:MAG: hypothetical protein KDK66_08665 [Deltaproteobacteria bacterium]|nr:hypothetical protein [Deltaproteobacteria bacterium]
MKKNFKFISLLTAGLILGASFWPKNSQALDYADSPMVVSKPQLDICNLYAWSNDEGHIVAIITFACNRQPDEGPLYDDSVLYSLHIDNTATIAESDQVFDNNNDNESDIDIHILFGQNQIGEWGVQVHHLPGLNGSILSGPVQTILEQEDSDGSRVKIIAGLFDDPFFADFEGIQNTLSNLISDTDPEDLQFTSLDVFTSLMPTGLNTDFFAGTNTMAIVMEFSAMESLANNTESFLQIWATTATRL